MRLRWVWDAADRICGKRLKATLSSMVAMLLAHVLGAFAMTGGVIGLIARFASWDRGNESGVTE